MDMRQVFETFLQESDEIIEELDNTLLEIESGGVDKDNLNRLFRAAHTLKGSGGLFALTELVNFTHQMETLLDLLRENPSLTNNETINLLFLCFDHLKKLKICIDVDSGQILMPAETAKTDAFLKEALASLRQQLTAGEKPAGQPESSVSEGREESENSAPVDSNATACGENLWHVSVRFARDLFRSGFNPLKFIALLQEQFETSAVRIWAPDVPVLADLVAEDCYLGFELRGEGEISRTAIEDIFLFVQDEVDLFITHGEGIHTDLTARMEKEPEPIRKSLAQIWSELDDELLDHGVSLDTLGLLDEAGDEVLTPKVQASVESQQSPRQTIEVSSKTAETSPEKPSTATPASSAASSASQKTIRVAADKLDHLINLVGELVISNAGVSLLARMEGSSQLQESCEHVSGLIEEIRNCSLQLRMVPIGETFNRFRRVVRDIGNDLGKEIQLEIRGGDTELDKSVVEKINDPLTHIIRNAIDHGIEMPQVREANAKSRQGTVILSARHESSNIVIEIEDDGAGINADRVRSKAIANGLIDSSMVLDDHQVLQLIFEPGLSTAEKVTDLSGRGVGMDVVKRNIEALRGSVSLESTPGKGTRFRIGLPLTLAIIDGFHLKVGDNDFVLPLEMVEECLEAGAPLRGKAMGHVEIRGECLPYLDLAAYFQVASGRAANRRNMIVVRQSGQRFCLVVDELLGEFQTVLKPLGALFGHSRGIGGSTILGNGRVALILDTADLVAQVCGMQSERVAQAAGSHEK